MPGFTLCGHRGARGLFPENTLQGFGGALALGVDALELDVAVTQDEVVVVSHDPRLDPDITRGPDGAWLGEAGLGEAGPRIGALPFAALEAYDVGRIRPGTRHAAAFPARMAVDGARIPALRAVLEEFPAARFLVEMKTFPDSPGMTVAAPEMAGLVAGVIAAAGAVSRVTVQSLDWRGLRHLRAEHPEVRLAWLTQARDAAGRWLWWDGSRAAAFEASVPGAVAAEGGTLWVPEFGELSEGVVAEAHGLGMRVVPWDVNAQDRMRLVVGWGVDGMITDRPDLALPILREAGLRGS